MGGSLSFKGEKKKSKKKSKTTKHKSEEKEVVSVVVAASNHNDDIGVEEEEDHEDMTEAERKALKRKLERQREDNKKIALKSHRERVEELNDHLGSLTELNDIPRVSAAGNG